MEKINIAELLKDCSSGMELDCTMYDNVVLEFVANVKEDTYPIKLKTKKGTLISTTEYGCYDKCSDAKCVIFPKGKTSWEGFKRPFKDGDILTTNIGSIFIFSHLESDWNDDRKICKAHVGIQDTMPISFFHTEQLDIFGPYESMCELATEEEKSKLFQAIKDNGYKWNPETKTLEKLVEQKFKVGDTITNGKTSITIGYIDDEYYYEISRNIANRLFIKNQDEWDLISEKFPNKFNINTLVPFESRVLVRNDEGQYWIPAFWGCKRADGYTTTFGWCKYCIPFEGNEHLLETNNDCNEYYKTWK